MTTLNIALSNTLEANTLPLFSESFALGATLDLDFQPQPNEECGLRTIQEDAGTIRKRLQEMQRAQSANRAAHQAKVNAILHGDVIDSVAVAKPAAQTGPSWSMMLAIISSGAIMGVVAGLAAFLF